MSLPLIAEKKVSWAIVDDHSLFRKGVVRLINDWNNNYKYSLVFEAGSGEEMRSKLKETIIPDILLLDISMKEMDGYKAAEWLEKQYPSIKVVVISMYKSEEAIMKMISLGVEGYISKVVEPDEMKAALEEVVEKGFCFTGDMLKLVTDNMVHTGKKIGTAKSTQYSLSKNEEEFLVLLCDGLTNNEIADKMSLSPKTIDGYREHLFKRFGVHSRVSLVVFAMKNGLVIA